MLVEQKGRIITDSQFSQQNLQDEFKARYHARSNVESTFSLLKRKFGERLRSKTLTAQTNEILWKVLCHNVCVLIRSIYELGVEVDLTTKSTT